MNDENNEKFELTHIGRVIDEFGQIISVNESLHRSNAITIGIFGQQIQPGMIHAWFKHEEVLDLIAILQRGEEFLMDKDYFIREYGLTEYYDLDGDAVQPTEVQPIQMTKKKPVEPESDNIGLAIVSTLAIIEFIIILLMLI